MSLVPAHEPPSARCLSNTAIPHPLRVSALQRCRMIRYQHLLKNLECHTNIPVKSVTLGAFMHIQASIDPCVPERGDEKKGDEPDRARAHDRFFFQFFSICLEGCDGMKMQERASLRWEALRRWDEFTLKQWQRASLVGWRERMIFIKFLLWVAWGTLLMVIYDARFRCSPSRCFGGLQVDLLDWVLAVSRVLKRSFGFSFLPVTWRHNLMH